MNLWPDVPASPGERRSLLRSILSSKGVSELEQPIELSSGARSRYFVDAKRALAAGHDLALASVCMLDLLADRDVVADAVGGLTLGADQFAHGVAIMGGLEWFVVRKQPKGRGTDRYIEGADVRGKRILLVDDVITSGGSSLTANGRIVAEGGRAVLATTLVARSDEPFDRFAAAGIPFWPLFTYADLGIPPVGSE